jgi:hypothetical protein
MVLSLQSDIGAKCVVIAYTLDHAVIINDTCTTP